MSVMHDQHEAAITLGIISFGLALHALLNWQHIMRQKMSD